MKRYYTVTVELTVHDPAQLYLAAHAHSVKHDRQTPEEAAQMLKPSGPDGDVDIGACLITLIDPGSLPGCDIENSGAEHVLTDGEIQ
jgi:hypothetical protein